VRERSSADVEVKFGLFKNFKGSDTLLIWGDAVGLTQLALVLRQLAVGKISSIPIHEVSWAKSARGTQLLLRVSADRGHMTVGGSNDEMLIDWACSRGMFDQFSDQVSSLLGAPSGHQYLEGQPDQPLQVMVSKGEYDKEDLDAKDKAIEEARADVAAGRVIPWTHIKRWLESWGTDNELPPPTLER
jgi:hypothetical protein